MNKKVSVGDHKKRAETESQFYRVGEQSREEEKREEVGRNRMKTQII